jgi:hypothetical protein
MLDWLYHVSIRDQVYLVLMSVTILIMLINYHRLASNVKPFLLFSLAQFSLELLSDYVNYGLHKSNLILYHLFAPVSYLILTVFFYRTFTATSTKKNTQLSLFLYYLLLLIYTFSWEPISKFNSLAYMTESLFVIYWCFVFFKTILLREDLYRPERDRTFWIVIGLLFYYVGSFFTIGSLSYFLTNHLKNGFTPLGSKIYYAGYAFNYLFYITLCILSLIEFPLDSHE